MRNREHALPECLYFESFKSESLVMMGLAVRRQMNKNLSNSQAMRVFQLTHSKMEDSKSISSIKDHSSQSSSRSSSAEKRALRSGQSQPFRLHTESRGQIKQQAFLKRLQELVAEEAKNRIPVAQGLPLTTDKPEILYKPPSKEQTKPLDIKLHTQQRATRRAGFNDLVAIKLSWLKEQRQQVEKITKMIEEEEIRSLRKELIPRAQLMPLFDRPFFPQRSTRPLTVPREPSFKILSNQCWNCMSCNGNLYHFDRRPNQIMKPIK
ncbi:TPX2 (targeting protein for Xklp2) protein family isoform X2 [Tasmannia lanceolata]|uniref:TPX2 (targeting protein for Xklp2) protein family isoform X2 n=1 Tax=Tasmannia lanceolata TaxID=3420 RepID=UPI0040637A43